MERNQTILIVTVCTMICFSPIVHFINQLCRTIFGTGVTLDTLICYLALAILLLASLKQLHYQIKPDALFILVLFALAFGLTYSFVDANQRYMFTEWTDFAGNPAYLLFVFSLPAYVFMRYITDYERMFEVCRYFSLAAVFCSFGSFLLMILRNVQPEYMSFSYNLLFGTIFSTVYFFEKKKVLSLIAAIVGVLLIFLAGARGPLACYIFSLVICFLLSKISVSKKICLALLFITLGLICMVLWEEILLGLQGIVEALGISSRTVDLLLSGEISNTSGRGEIQQMIIEGFTLFGRGLYGDRVVGENHYAHNLIIELISQWGYLMGTLIVAVLGVLIFKGFRTKNTNLRLLIFAFFSSSVIKLMFSESYLAHNAVFFVMIAACVNTIEEAETPKITAEELALPERKKSKYIKASRRFG